MINETLSVLLSASLPGSFTMTASRREFVYLESPDDETTKTVAEKVASLLTTLFDTLHLLRKAQ